MIKVFLDSSCSFVNRPCLFSHFPAQMKANPRHGEDPLVPHVLFSSFSLKWCLLPPDLHLGSSPTW